MLADSHGPHRSNLMMRGRSANRPANHAVDHSSGERPARRLPIQTLPYPLNVLRRNPTFQPHLIRHSFRQRPRCHRLASIPEHIIDRPHHRAPRRPVWLGAVL